MSRPEVQVTMTVCWMKDVKWTGVHQRLTEPRSLTNARLGLPWLVDRLYLAARSG